jgi:hypothetical protein
MRGAAGNAVVFAGASRGSRLVEVIESGDMPRGGGKVTPEQLDTLKRWIDEGARFDGPNRAAPLASFVAAGTSVPSRVAEGATVQPAVGEQGVSFARQIAPILNEQCHGCHIDGQRASGNLRMDTFEQFWRGGDSGVVITGRNASESLLIRKLKGEAGERMPAGGRPPLSDEQISLISTWIREGAMFDGPSPNMKIGTVVNQAWASSATHEQLFQRRQDGALARWQRALPNDQPTIAVEGDIFVLGNLMPDHLQQTLAQLTKAAEQVKSQLRIPPREPLVRGGVSVFALKSRYDYGEFGRMTESRELPRAWLGHWHADVLDVYGVLSSNELQDPKQAESLALHVISGMALGSLNATPTWFAEGVARNLVAANFRRSDPRVRAWQQSLPDAMRQVGNAQVLLDGSLDEETAGLVGTSLANFMMGGTNRRRFDRMLEVLRAGQTFDRACTATYAPPEALVKQWLGK